MEAIRTTLLVPLWEGGASGLLLILNGLQVTLVVTALAIGSGLVLGTCLALLRLSHRGVLRGVARAYIETIRGTPVLVQLLIIYFVVFQTVNVDKTFAAVVAFAVNSSAYIAEIIRAGIQAVDRGQTEAARSLGLSHLATMRLVIIPQAVRNILPALGNEFIVLLKETSIIGFIGGNDLMRASNKIRSITYQATIPLFTVAIIYLLLTLALSYLFSLLERRLRRHARADRLA